jgi:D-amino-acid oxidase
MAEVVVVGAGVIGLTTAIRLQQAGAQVTVVTADEPRDTVSALAAAVWYPSHTDGDERSFDWSRRGYDELTDQAAHGVPGVVLRPTRMLLRRTTSRPWWAPAVPDFREVPAPPGYTGEWNFTVPSVEMLPYLDWLVEQFVAGGGRLHHQAIDLFEDVDPQASIVVNATGLAAFLLAGDAAVRPARGQIVRVVNPGLHVSIRDEDDPSGMVYIHPRSRDVVLGGTFEPDVYDTTVHEDTSRFIIRRCVALVPELAGASVIDHVAGLRPARDGGARVAEQPGGLRSGQRLIHNYGHGGAGVTMAWGCADEIVRLAGSEPA